MVRRRARVVGAVAAVVLLAIVCVRLLRRPGSGPAAPHGGPPSAQSAPGAQPKAPRRRAPRPIPDAEEVAPSAGASGLPYGPGLFTPFQVAVRRSEGPWVRGTEAVVYALRPGDSGAGGPAARSAVLPDGTCTLHLPEPGVYDVGAVLRGEFHWTLATDVDTRTGGPLVLTLPPRDEIRFTADPGFSPQGSGYETVVADARVTAVTPGRGAVPACRWMLDNDRLPQSLWAPRGLRLRAVQGGDRTRCAPDHFAAPAAVAVRADERGSYVLRVTVDPPDRVARHDVILRVQFEVEGGGVTDRWDDLRRTWIVLAGRRVADVVSLAWTQRAPAAFSTIRWSGDGVLPGEAAMEVPDGRTVEVPVVLRLAPALPGEAEAVVRIDGAPEPFEVRCSVVDGDGEAAELDVRAPSQDVTVPVPPVPAPHGLVAWSKTRASDPMRFVAGGRHALVLRPSGWLRIRTGDLEVPEGVTLVLRRADGMPFPVTHGGPGDVLSRNTTWACSELLGNFDGARLGPLPEGDVAFVVRYAGTPVAEFTARVVAGATRDAHVPFRRPAAPAAPESPR